MRPGHHLQAFVEVLHRGQAVGKHDRRQARNHAHQRGKGHQHGRHKHQRDQARQHQVADGVDAHRTQRVDLFVGLHARQLRGKGGTQPPREDHARHQSGHFTHHADGHDIGDVALRADAVELRAAHVGQHQADEATGQRHDGQRKRPGLVDLAQQVTPVHVTAATQQAPTRNLHLPEKAQRQQRVLPPAGHATGARFVKL